MPKFAANLSMMFNEVTFLQRFERAAKAGFHGVEFLFPYQEPVDVIKEQLEKHHLQQVLFNMPPGDWQAGERGIASLPDREEEFKTGVAQAIHYATMLKCSQIHVMAGLLQPHLTYAEQRQCYIDNLRYAANQLAVHQINLLIEPINTRDMPGYFLNTQRDAESLLAEINCPNLFIQLDLYHCQIMEGDLMRTIERLWGRFTHIQIASVPLRNEPDSGEVNYPWIFEQLDNMGYSGWVGCEYRPATTTEAGLGWLSNHKLPIL